MLNWSHAIYARTETPEAANDIIKARPELQTIVDASPRGDLTFLLTEFRKPFSANGFGNWFRKRCDEAGLTRCPAHSLRKAAATRLADLGAQGRGA